MPTNTHAHGLRVFTLNYEVVGNRLQKFVQAYQVPKELQEAADYLQSSLPWLRFLFKEVEHMGRVADTITRLETKISSLQADNQRLQTQITSMEPNVLDATDIAALDKADADQAATGTTTTDQAATGAGGGAGGGTTGATDQNATGTGAGAGQSVGGQVPVGQATDAAKPGV